MGKGYKHGGSGGADPLNFYVKTYPSEVELKTDKPKENTIGVITTTTMTSWIFSATEPTEPEVGMVWISVGTSSPVEFNALKSKTLQVYPLEAKQYVGGKFEVVTSMIYQNGEWISIEKTLFPPVDGWSTTKIQSDRTIGTGTFDGDVFTGKITAGGQGVGITKQSVDFTNITYVDVYFTESGFNQDSGDGGGVVALVTDNEYLSGNNSILSKWASAAECSKGVMRLDVSGISGTHRFVAGIVSWASASGASGSITIPKIVEVT